jgi:hypothetical protein
MYIAQIKSESVTNQAILAFLDALTVLRPHGKSLEWAADFASLSIPLPSGTAVDDGGLVHRFRDSTGKWTLHPASI